MNKYNIHNIQCLVLKSFYMLVTFSLKKIIMLTEIWPAYSDEIHGTWRETKSFKRLGEKDPTCHESDRSIQKQGIELRKPPDDGGLVVRGEREANLEVLGHKAIAAVVTRF